ncbi:MAG: hypothetical protein HAW67_07080 [Endozoicomonadaceae bacterium]|nr:hypothetical protein [Endozoicomonadaceae bacterium]
MGIFDNFWATGVSVRVLESQGLVADDLPELSQRTLKMIAISLKDKGMNKNQATNTLNRLATKHGNLIQAMEFYSKTFGI